jgi:hypothetical protein
MTPEEQMVVAAMNKSFARLSTDLDSIKLAINSLHRRLLVLEAGLALYETEHPEGHTVN